MWIDPGRGCWKRRLDAVAAAWILAAPLLVLACLVLGLMPGRGAASDAPVEYRFSEKSASVAFEGTHAIAGYGQFAGPRKGDEHPER